ncbi:anthranilate phosphoribosyltransferase [Coralliovum pocilloporae]|uniref:anthranilate phosphoribosyltransferase n=1 Tax=Coralliovum pocilloporae TaxID=3066369 RepID=UPI0033075CCC
MTDLKPLLAQAADGKALSRQDAEAAFNIIMSGGATPAQIGGFLMALRVRGETVDEIAGAVATMRSKMLRVNAPDGAIDIVGTGGDASGTYNISTTSAFVVAGAGVPVAKHGNRALSSKSGTADALMALGVNLDLEPEQITRCIETAGVGFMFAPNHHAAMKHVGPARVELGTRTIFNLLGPLSNPAGVKHYAIGVFAAHWVEPIAHALRDLGAESAWIVHGDSGLDELSITGPNLVAELKNGEINTFEIAPEDVGLTRRDLEEIKGGDAEENATALKAVLDGDLCAYRDTVLMNAGSALVVTGKAKTLTEGVEMAARSIDSGKARKALDLLVETSNGS